MDYVPSWQQQIQTFGQTPAMNGSIMSGYNPNIANPSSGLTPAFADPTGVLGVGTTGVGIPSIGDIGKGVASANWRVTPQGAGSGFGMNMPTFALGLQGLNSLGSLVMGAKSLGLANKQFAAAQNTTFQNGRNQTLAYNDTLATRIKRIGSGSGTSKEEMDAEIARRQLPDYVKG